MDQRLAAADAALKAGRNAEAIDLIVALLSEAPDQPQQVYRVLLRQFYFSNRHEEGAVWAERATAKHPRDVELWNLRGIILRRLARYDEALKALETAVRLNPKDRSALVNKGNIHNDRGEGAKAEAIFTQLVRQDPRVAEHQRALAKALINQKKYDQAAVRLRQALTLKKDYVDAWLDLSGMLSGRQQHDDALEINEKALAAVPGDMRLLESKAVNLLRAGRHDAAEAFMMSLLPEHDNAAWLHHQLGFAVSSHDRPRANVHLARAVELAPANQDYKVTYAESLERSRFGDEAQNIEAGYRVLRDAMALGPLNVQAKKIASEIMIRLGDFEANEQLGELGELGAAWATTERQTALLKLLARVRTDQDRRDLLHAHRLWGRIAEDTAQRLPIRRPAQARSSSKIRLGFMSSDLRNHPVAYFVMPLFDHVDRERFEIYCYSFYRGEEDATQRYVASRIDGFRWRREITDRDAAQMIADDDLDMLIELGGSTHMNKIEVMAYRPARLSASWLGYPHSAGLSTIDYLVVDPFLSPPDEKLILEKPLSMPRSWIAMGERAFPETHEIDPRPPVERKGVITFGTANNPYKYTASLIDTWARVVAAVPDSRFLFVRPEAGAPTFQANMVKAFAKHGVSADRVLFEAVRGAHMPFYNDIDIALDTFPQTGGTTTCESLWMGVPTVTVVGPSVFERLSYSILNNAGLADLCAKDAAEFHDIAVRLAGDRARIGELRRGLRERLKASPLGQTKAFAADFYDMIARTVDARLPAPAAA
jgi:predicted O-linked N-acetylglucosamine transferase (SPINDLY family)